MSGIALLLATAASMSAAASDWRCTDLDSTPRLPVNKLLYLEQLAGRCPTPRDEPESLNVRLVGKWGGGPSWAVTGRDTLVFLSRGSEVVALSFADPDNPRTISHIQARRLAARPVLSDSLLYLATSGWIEVFNVRDPANAFRVGRQATPVSDIDVEGTTVYSISADSLKVWDFSNPQSPVLLGACRDSGYALDFDRGYAYLCNRWGLYVIDVSNPQSPHRVAAWGTDITAVRARGNHCYVTQGSMGSNSLHVLNVANPAAPWQEGVLSGTTGEDIYLVDSLLFLPGFDIVSIADSSRPRLVGHADVGGPKIGVWVDESLRLGFVVADYVGLHVLDLASTANPTPDTVLLGAGEALDVSVAGELACVACFRTDAVVLNVASPATPTEVGRYTGPGYVKAVINAESIAYVPAYSHTQDTVLHAVDISDPAHPVLVGSAGGWEGPSALALRDSLLFAAEPYKFEVFNVANPRQPVWMGSCNLAGYVGGVSVQDSFVYVSPDIQVINVARPAQPVRVSTTSCNSWDMVVTDTFGYVSLAYESLRVYSVADPTRPRRLSSSWVPGQARAVTLADTSLLLGCDEFRVYTLDSPAAPRLRGRYATPYFVRRIDSRDGLAYAACYLAGVCVLEQLPSSVAERDAGVRKDGGQGGIVVPNPVRRWARLARSFTEGASEAAVVDAQGRMVLKVLLEPSTYQDVSIDLGSLRPGVYFVAVRPDKRGRPLRLVKL